MAAKRHHKKAHKKKATIHKKHKRKLTLSKLNTRVTHIENFLAKASSV